MSLAWWDQDDSAGMEGDHAVVVGGYGKLVAALAAQTSVLLQVSKEASQYHPLTTDSLTTTH